MVIMHWFRFGCYLYVVISVTEAARLNLLFFLNEKREVNAQSCNKQEGKCYSKSHTHRLVKYMKLSSHPLFKQNPHNDFT